MDSVCTWEKVVHSLSLSLPSFISLPTFLPPSLSHPLSLPFLLFLPLFPSPSPSPSTALSLHPPSLYPFHSSLFPFLLFPSSFLSSMRENTLRTQQPAVWQEDTNVLAFDLKLLATRTEKKKNNYFLLFKPPSLCVCFVMLVIAD